MIDQLLDENNLQERRLEIRNASSSGLSTAGTYIICSKPKKAH
jgi:hypothetical protein